MAQLGLAQAQVTSLALHINSDSHHYASNDTINTDDTRYLIPAVIWCTLVHGSHTGLYTQLTANQCHRLTDAANDHSSTRSPHTGLTQWFQAMLLPPPARGRVSGSSAAAITLPLPTSK